MKKILLTFFAVGSVFFVAAVFYFLQPMTICMTFDDGFKVHHEVAAVELQKRGWSGCFNIPTDFMDPNHLPLRPDQLKDFCLKTDRDAFMTWDDVTNMVAHGHEIHSHSCDHSDMKRLEDAGRFDEVERQVLESKEQIELHTGLKEWFMCSPHDSYTPRFKALLLQNGIQWLDWRYGVGGSFLSDGQDAKQFLLGCYSNDSLLNVDFMIHGIGNERGGWRPFESDKSFVAFLDVVKDLEREGIVKVVPLSVAHKRGGQSLGNLRICRMFRKALRKIYCKFRGL